MSFKLSAASLGFKEKRFEFAGIELLRFVLAFFVVLNHSNFDLPYLDVVFNSLGGDRCSHICNYHRIFFSK
ncbi:MAG: hypothetical protein LBH55_02765 [Mycoplasmataceae bacterium]|jgi:peptidoglycan/LPS O-acetylase OafA/YrhL|nr:hypothetical protein [Mycoplasmataceae bacterium]